MTAAEQQACRDAPNSAGENDAGSPKCIEAVDVALKAYRGSLDDAMAAIYAYHIQRLDEVQQKHPEFYDSQEVALREVGRELLLRKITS